MFTSGSRALPGAFYLITLVVSAVPSAQNPPSGKDGPSIPAGAEKAVKAALAACPGAVLEDVETPSQSIGLGGANDTFWTLQLRVGGTQESISASADGVLIRSNKDVEPKDLPTTVGNGLSRVAPKGAARITKLETLGVVRYTALPAPEIRYSARVSSATGTVTITVSPDGTVLGTKQANGVKKTPAVDRNARTTDGPIPEQATKAVQAMREVFPSMVFDLVEEVPFLDSSTQTMEMLWYEVEFFLDGVKHEFNATPDGIVISFTKTIPATDLPRGAADALAKAVPDGKIEEVMKSETRAEPRFVALTSPVVVYEIQPRGEAGEAPAGIKLRIDGTEVKEPELPDWAKAPPKKQGPGKKYR